MARGKGAKILAGLLGGGLGYFGERQRLKNVEEKKQEVEEKKQEREDALLESQREFQKELLKMQQDGRISQDDANREWRIRMEEAKADWEAEQSKLDRKWKAGQDKLDKNWRAGQSKEQAASRKILAGIAAGVAAQGKETLKVARLQALRKERTDLRKEIADLNTSNRIMEDETGNPKDDEDKAGVPYQVLWDQNWDQIRLREDRLEEIEGEITRVDGLQPTSQGGLQETADAVNPDDVLDEKINRAAAGGITPSKSILSPLPQKPTGQPRGAETEPQPLSLESFLPPEPSNVPQPTVVPQRQGPPAPILNPKTKLLEGMAGEERRRQGYGMESNLLSFFRRDRQEHAQSVRNNRIAELIQIQQRRGLNTAEREELEKLLKEVEFFEGERSAGAPSGVLGGLIKRAR